MLLIFNIDNLQENFRIFDVSSGVEGSFGHKLGGLSAYLKNANPIYFVTGSLSSSLSVQVDAEWGYVFVYFGVLGLYWYVNFLHLLGRNRDTVPFLSISPLMLSSVMFSTYPARVVTKRILDTCSSPLRIA